MCTCINYYKRFSHVFSSIGYKFHCRWSSCNPGWWLWEKRGHKKHQKETKKKKSMFGATLASLPISLFVKVQAFENWSTRIETQISTCGGDMDLFVTRRGDPLIHEWVQGQSTQKAMWIGTWSFYAMGLLHAGSSICLTWTLFHYCPH